MKGGNEQEDQLEDQPLPWGQILRKGEDAQSTENRSKETGENKDAEEGPSLCKIDVMKDAKGAHGLSAPKGPFWHFMDMKSEKRLAIWKERRSRFGDVNLCKCYPYGEVFSPFQALTTMEMKNLAFPRDLPLSSRSWRIGASYLRQMNLQDLSLSSSELDLRQGDQSYKKGKTEIPEKLPLFPQS